MGRRVSALLGAPIAAKTQARLSPHLPLSQRLRKKLLLWKGIYRCFIKTDLPLPHPPKHLSVAFSIIPLVEHTGALRLSPCQPLLSVLILYIFSGLIILNHLQPPNQPSSVTALSTLRTVPATQASLFPFSTWTISIHCLSLVTS